MRRGASGASGRSMPAALEGASRKPALVVFAIIIVVTIFVLFLPPLGLLRGGDSENDDPGSTTTSGDIPTLPEGLEAVSPLYELKLPADAQGQRSVSLTVRLTQVLDRSTGVNLYTYEDGQYRRIASGELTEDGTAVTATVERVPDNIIALRRVTFTREVHGWLPAGAELSPDAEQVLSVLNPVDYAPDPEGIIRPLGNQRPLGGQFRIMPTVRAQTPEDVDAVDSVLADQNLREDHIQSIVFMVDSGNFEGVDIDYRDVSEARGTDFSRFITSLADELHKANKLLSVTLPFPAVDDAGIIDTGAYDWSAIALAADYIRIMPERDQAKYQAHVTAVLRDITETVDPGKILLVLSPYAVEKTPDGFSLHTLGQAMAIASQIEITGEGDVIAGSRVNLVAPHINQEGGASGLLWSDDSLSVQFTWPENGGNHTIWIENVFSVGFKLQLVSQFGLAGVAIEDVGDDPLASNLWPAVLTYVEDGKPTLLKPNGTFMQPFWDSPGGTLQGGETGKSIWTAPSKPGEYEVTLVLSDGVVRMGTNMTIQVLPRAGAPDETPAPDESPTPDSTREPRDTSTPTPTQ